MNKQQIKELALANGFKLKQQLDGTEDLNPYVYEFAVALSSEAGLDGFIAGYNQAQSDPFTANDTEIDLYADEYAASVMVGEK